MRVCVCACACACVLRFSSFSSHAEVEFIAFYTLLLMDYIQ